MTFVRLETTTVFRGLTFVFRETTVVFFAVVRPLVYRAIMFRRLGTILLLQAALWFLGLVRVKVRLR